MRRLFLLVFVSFTLAHAGAQSRVDPLVLLAKADFQTPTGPLASQDFTLPTLDGHSMKLSSLRGSVVLLNFWATWCPPCQAEIPSMESFFGKLKDKGLKILAVDVGENKTKVQDFVKKTGMKVTVLLDVDGQIGQLYGAQSIPTTYVIGAKGDIIARTIGGRDWDTPQMLTLFQTLLAVK
jgi:thiol-disulfide isomerase/thioredoxin